MSLSNRNPEQILDTPLPIILPKCEEAPDEQMTRTLNAVSSCSLHRQQALSSFAREAGVMLNPTGSCKNLSHFATTPPPPVDSTAHGKSSGFSEEAKKEAINIHKRSDSKESGITW
jgi:hypothetical protein